MKAKNQKSVAVICIDCLVTPDVLPRSFFNLFYLMYRARFIINLLVVMSASVRFSHRKSSDGNVEESEVPSIIRDK